MQSIQQKYTFCEKIGQGSFGHIWRMINIETGETFACKIVKNEDSKQKMILQKEISILLQLQGKKGFPQLKGYGSDAKYFFFLMTLLGKNLEQLKQLSGNKMTTSSIYRIAIQLLERIRGRSYNEFNCFQLDLHEVGILHRDIKPQNIVVDSSESNQIYLIDFGLSKPFIENNQHITFRQNRGLVGTPRYASVSALKGNEQCRKDDLESIGYLLIYLATGSLPWANIKTSGDKKEKYSKIIQVKELTTVQSLTYGLPLPFREYMVYVKCLTFYEKPNYDHLIELFKNESSVDKKTYDWESNHEKFSDVQEQVSIERSISQVGTSQRARISSSEKSIQKPNQNVITQKKDDSSTLLKQIQKKQIQDKLSKKTVVSSNPQCVLQGFNKKKIQKAGQLQVQYVVASKQVDSSCDDDGTDECAQIDVSKVKKELRKRRINKTTLKSMADSHFFSENFQISQKEQHQVAYLFELKFMNLGKKE